MFSATMSPKTTFQALEQDMVAIYKKLNYRNPCKIALLVTNQMQD
jgi:hypothetical protein